MSAPRPSELEIQEATKDLEKRYSDPGLRQTMLRLFLDGLIVAGDRRDDGSIRWVAAEISPRH